LWHPVGNCGIQSGMTHPTPLACVLTVFGAVLSLEDAYRLVDSFEPTGISNCYLFICSSSSIPGGFHAPGRGRVRETPTKYMASVKEPQHGLLVPTNGSQSRPGIRRVASFLARIQ
jgi:hypothetical protein